MMGGLAIFVSAIALVSLVVIFGLYSEINAQPMIDEQNIDQLAINSPPDYSSRNLASASGGVTVSATVLPGLSLTIVDNEPDYATNSAAGATLSVDYSQAPIIYWTTSANF